MNSEFRTAKKGTSEFDQLIRGTFSATQRALPVHNLRVGSSEEEVTFEIVDKKEVKPWVAYRGFIGPKKLLYVLFPIFYFSMLHWSQPFLHSAELECLILGLVLSLLAVQMKVDTQDFISGYDRIRSDKSQKVLNKGWRTVAQLERDFKIVSGLAVLMSVIPLLMEPVRVLSLLATLVLFFVGYSWGVSRKNRLVRDIALGLIAGPALAFWILPHAKSLAFGVVWGCLVFFSLQLEHFQHYFAQTQAGEKNLVTMKSFDQAPSVIWAVWGVCLIVYALMRSLSSHVAWWGGALLVLIVMSFIWRKSLFRLQSPAGSEIDKIVRLGNQLYYTFITLWIAELLFKAFVAPIVAIWFR